MKKYIKLHRLKKILVLISFIMLSQSIILAQAKDPDPARFSDAIEDFMGRDAKNSYLENQNLFLGSSSIRMWKTALAFPDGYVINRGFGGSHISDVNHYYKQIVRSYKPARIFFYAGDNDIAAGKSPDQVLEDYKIFIAQVEKDLPKTKVYYLSIKPSLSRWSMWPEMKQANVKIRKFTETKDNLFYLDTATPMLNAEDRPKPQIFLDDGLHMNEEGYKIWNKIISPYLK